MVILKLQENLGSNFLEIVSLDDQDLITNLYYSCDHSFAYFIH